MKKFLPLTTPGFLLGLALLLLNDHYLKGALGNWWTGKLSDFAGLFIFPIFWAVLLPRHTGKVYWATALLFVFWKSPSSQPVIDFANSILPFRISRVVDFSDCLALLVLPASYLYLRRPNPFILPVPPGLVMAMASIAFVATSYITDVPFEKKYDFAFPLDTLHARLNQVENARTVSFIRDTVPQKRADFLNDLIDGDSAQTHPALNPLAGTMEMSIQDDFCRGSYNAIFSVGGDSSISWLHTNRFNHGCPEDEKDLPDREILSKSFEEKVIAHLR